MSATKVEQWVDDTISDLLSSWFYYDRKEDEDMSPKQLLKLMEDKVITKEMILEKFTKHLDKAFE